MRALGILAVLAAFAAGAAGCGGGGKVALPAGFPADFPVPPGASLRTAQDLGARGLNLVFAVPGEVERVDREQRSRMEAAGWLLVAEVAVERGRVRSWRRAGASASVAVAVGPAGALVSVGYQPLRTGGAEGGGT